MSVFEGLADIFAEALGEPVIYTPTASAPATIQAIWVVDTVTAGLAGVDAVLNRVTAHVRAVDVPGLAEGDTISRGGQTYRVVPPFLPDGRGMMSIALEYVSG